MNLAAASDWIERDATRRLIIIGFERRTRVLQCGMDAQGGPKRCSRCGLEKAVSEYTFKNRRTGLLHTFCRACHKIWNRRHYERNRAAYIAAARRNRGAYLTENLRRLVAYLRDHPCLDCGERDLLVLEFDHRDRSTKRLPVSCMLDGYGWGEIEAEISKCDVRCANCHRRRTAHQLGWRKVALTLLPTSN